MSKQRFRNISFILTGTLAAVLFLAACNLQSTSGNPAGQPNDVVEQIVQQTFAAFTQAAANPNVTPDESARQAEMAQAVA